MKRIYLFALALSLSFACFATVRNVPGTFTTVQAALAACNNNDTILVQPGIYTGNIVWPNKSGIKLLSAADSSSTTLTAGGSGKVLSFSLLSAVDTNTVVKGFTITGGFVNTSNSSGAGISITTCSAKFVDCAITNNHLSTQNWAYGAGVYMSQSSSVFRNCSIWNNRSDTAGWGYGGGIHMANGGSPIFYNVKICGNRVNSNSWCYGVGAYIDGTNATFTNVSFSGNTTTAGSIWYYGGGLYVNNANVTVTNGLVANNVMNNSGSFYYGGGIYLDGGTSSFLTLVNVTIANNMRTNAGPITGSGIYTYSGTTLTATNIISYNTNNAAELSSNGTATVTYSDIRGGFTGTGNINANPGFVSANDLHLSPTSPCAGAGTATGAPSMDLDLAGRPQPVATNPDMGCYEVDQLTAITLSLVEEFSLKNYPNPFTQFTTLQLSLTETSHAELTIYDLGGKLVKELVNGDLPKGITKFTFDGASLPSGLYFAKLIANNEVKVIKLVKE